MNFNVTTGNVSVNNASIFYKTYGEGKPILFMITGGTGDADSYENIIPFLIGKYTVVTYDRRGYARSPIASISDQEIINIETQTDDVRALLRAITKDPVCVFGSSIGAVIALDLAARYPSLVKKVIAHEPPLVNQLPESERAGKVPEIMQNETPFEAMRRFTETFGLVPSNLVGQKFMHVSKDAKKRKTANTKFFLEHESKGVDRYKLNTEKIKGVRSKIVFIAGKESKGNFLYELAIQTAQDIGAPFLEVLGHHVGYGQYPEEFSLELIEILESRQTHQQ
ncbi:MAG: alpha/beta hydrolase [Bacteroidales bacterium]|jgi:pimeloyl-ACP methyl ester carboxylesterase